MVQDQRRFRAMCSTATEYLVVKEIFDQFSRRSRLRGGDGDENFVQLVGWLAVFRGLVILKRVGDGTTREISDFEDAPMGVYTEDIFATPCFRGRGRFQREI